MGRKLSNKHQIQIKERSFSVVASDIKIKLDSPYFKKPVMIENVILVDNRITVSEDITESGIVLALVNFFATKSGRIFEVDDPEFKFECDINAIERIVSAVFKFQDGQLFIIKIEVNEE
jgi:hypothetical protein